MRMDSMNGSEMRTNGSKTFTGNSVSSTVWPFKYVNGVQTEASKALEQQRHAKATIMDTEGYDDALF